MKICIPCVVSVRFSALSKPMNKYYFAVLLLLLGFVALVMAQEVPGLHANDLAGAKILKTDTYAGKALFGYIDGGAELYLEYGFKELTRQEVLYSGERFVVETYQMPGPNEAYGIFSVQRFKCVPVDSFSVNTCLSKYQLQAVAGDCYLSIINETGSAAAQKGSIDIFRSLRAGIKPQDPELPALFRDAKLKPFRRNLLIAHGPLGLQNGFPDWLPYFESFQSFSLILLPIEDGSSQLCIGYARISCCGEIDDFWRVAGFEGKPTETLSAVKKNGLQMFARQIGKQVLLFAIATETFPGLTSYTDLLSK